MKFSTYTETTHMGVKELNSRLTKIISLIFAMCVFFLGHQQIVTAQTVQIPDLGLRAALELALGKQAGDDITRAEMTSLESLQASNCHFLTLLEMGFWWKAERWVCLPTDDMFEYTIQDLTGLEFATNLTHLFLDSNQISDISPLKDLTNLTHLSLGRNQISDISPLKDLTNLAHLSLIYNSVSDISPCKNLTKLIELDLEGNRLSNVSILKDLTNLTHLSIRKNQLSDISPLKNLRTLTYLSFRENQISDVSPLEDLTNLTYLHIAFNYTISDVSPLKNLTNLRHLQLDHNIISDVSPLKDLTDLRHLDASDNEISDLSSLKNLTKLTWIDLDTNKNLDLSHLKYFPNLTFLDIHDNEISDLSFLNVLTKLKRLDLDDNEISDVSPLEVLTNLTEVDLSGNHISDVSPLKGLTKLSVLDLHNNRISDVSPLSGLINLTKLDLRGNHVSDFSPLAGLIDNLVKYNTRNQTFPTYKREDVNRDGLVNIIDLVSVASNFGNPDLAALARMNIYPDVNSDGVVDIRDLVIIAAEMGSSAAPTLSKNTVETSNLTAENLSQWIQLAKKFDLQEPRTQKGIAVFEQLLEILTRAETPLKTTALLANYPNPFNPETWIPYQLAEPAEVNISIHSANGKLVRALQLGHLSAGIYHRKSRAAYWDGRNELGESVASGIYFYTFTARDFTATRKMIIQK